MQTNGTLEMSWGNLGKEERGHGEATCTDTNKEATYR
jgi:hypothetical protein